MNKNTTLLVGIGLIALLFFGVSLSTACGNMMGFSLLGTGMMRGMAFGWLLPFLLIIALIAFLLQHDQKKEREERKRK